MDSSDDEEELALHSVTNYYFVDRKDEPISFSVLPILFDEVEKPSAVEDRVFLHGNGDGGLQKVYKQVIAWKLVLKDDQPELSVLSKDKKWIKLLRPRKSYEECIRTILITVQLLHFLRKQPESSEKSLWGHLRKVFSSFEDRPSGNDIAEHYPLIKMLVGRDDALMKSQLLSAMLAGEKPMKGTFGENDSDAKKSFITGDEDGSMGDEDGNESEKGNESESEKEQDLFDSVCAICDNGGELLCCEGRCLRSFHATRRAGVDSECASLGYTRAQVEAIQDFLCLNCQFKQHQCFACKKLGSSDKSAGAEVFRCANATCGHFYHPKCAADLLFPGNETEALVCQKRVTEGQSFTCPVHKCIVCKQGENKEDKDLQFAICRRCPKAYHRKCLPRKISFEDIEEEDIVQRAWDDLLPSRVLIYCLKHKIDEELGTPIRNHIIFPEDPQKRKAMEMQKAKQKFLVKKERPSSVDSFRERISIKPVKVMEKFSSSEESQSVVRTGKGVLAQVRDFQKQLKSSKDTAQSGIRRHDLSSLMDKKRATKESTKTLVVSGSEVSAGKIVFSAHPTIDDETEKSIITLMRKASSSLKLEDIIRKRTMPSTHAYSGRQVDKTITLGKVEGSVEAIRTALQKLEENGSVEDAKAICEPEILRQLLKWNTKLKVYLAPFLHGVRYSSFGRHFTSVDKLKEIVDKLQWYVQNGDTLVDFCCGSNDFSVLMEETLVAAGKQCSFKNYDVIPPKNDFNFEKRDWMTVQPNELPTGSQLIMGLNPPFGVKASLANKFIDKALSFKPKLLILIVPQETERLELKNTPYDLIWEDDVGLSGKSFYLPGSVDVYDKQIEQWNQKPPPLYLWSRRDWTTKHKAIASKQGHTFEVCHESRVRKTMDTLPIEENVGKRQEPREAVRKTMDTLPIEENVGKRQEQREAVRKTMDTLPIEENVGKRQEQREAVRKTMDTLPIEENVEKRQEQREAVTPEATKRNNNSNGVDSNKRSPLRSSRNSVRKKRRRMKQQELRIKEASESRIAVKRARNESELSDMSISPRARDSDREPSRSHHHKETFANSRETAHPATEIPDMQRFGMEFEHRSHHRQETFANSRETAHTASEIPDMQRSGMEFEQIVGGLQATNNKNVDGIAQKYSRESMFSGSSRNWSHGGVGSRDSGIRRSSEERFSGYGNVDSFSRDPYMDGYRISQDADQRMQIGSMPPYSLASREDPSRFSRGGFESPPRHTPVFPSSSSYRLPSSAAEPSAMQRYAPRLDETNFAFGSGNPIPGGRDDIYDIQGMRRDMTPDPMGFARGPRHPYPHQGGSGGWLND